MFIKFKDHTLNEMCLVIKGWLIKYLFYVSPSPLHCVSFYIYSWAFPYLMTHNHPFIGKNKWKLNKCVINTNLNSLILFLWREQMKKLYDIYAIKMKLP